MISLKLDCHKKNNVDVKKPPPHSGMALGEVLAMVVKGNGNVFVIVLANLSATTSRNTRRINSPIISGVDFFAYITKENGVNTLAVKIERIPAIIIQYIAATAPSMEETRGFNGFSILFLKWRIILLGLGF